jgi:hypothetical protein
MPVATRTSAITTWNPERRMAHPLPARGPTALAHATATSTGVPYPRTAGTRPGPTAPPLSTLAELYLKVHRAGRRGVDAPRVERWKQVPMPEPSQAAWRYRAFSTCTVKLVRHRDRCPSGRRRSFPARQSESTGLSSSIPVRSCPRVADRTRQAERLRQGLSCRTCLTWQVWPPPDEGPPATAFGPDLVSLSRSFPPQEPRAFCRAEQGGEHVGGVVDDGLVDAGDGDRAIGGGVPDREACEVMGV